VMWLSCFYRFEFLEFNNFFSLEILYVFISFRWIMENYLGLEKDRIEEIERF
jgi:hypothetical protein